MRIIKLLLSAFILSVTAVNAFSQDCSLHDKFLREGDQLLNMQTPDYYGALQKYQAAGLAAKECDLPITQSDEKIQKLVVNINEARIQAEQQKQIAKSEAQVARNETQELQKVLRFREGLALVSNGLKFGYINKKAKAVISYKYQEALPFDYTGYAKVRRNGIDYLIDTRGNEYRFTDNINKLDETIEAFSFSEQIGFDEDSVQQKIFSNRQLKVLLLNKCKIKQLPTEIGQLENLRGLYMNHNMVSSLPPEISQLKTLQALDLNSNRLKTFPPEITLLRSLQKLYIRSNGLTNLPSQISELKALQVLNLGGNIVIGDNKITVLPTEIGQLKSLKILNLKGNQLTTLPPQIGQLKSLNELVLSYNKISILPPEIGQLQALQTLHLKGSDTLGKNQLTTLPIEIGQLTQLQVLDLRKNQYNFSKEEKQKIKKLLPDCEIKF